MDFDALLKQLQDWSNKVPLIVLGSGASVSFGLPSMWTLGEHLKRTLYFEEDSDRKHFETFKKILKKQRI